MAEPWQEAFLDEHRLPLAYLDTAARYFDPLVERLRKAQAAAAGSLCVALNGSQGSGKSTLSAYLRVALAERHGLSCLDLSLDDFYLTRAERESLAARVHPLLRTRGVPGTHDVRLLRDTLDALLRSESAEVAVPRFDKADDDRAPRVAWTRVAAPVAVVLLEGWCLGARAVTDAALREPLNDLERDEDRDGTWRRYANTCLREHYEPLYDMFDLWLMLALALTVSAVFILFYKPILYVAFDEQFARVRGIPVMFINYLLIILVALTIVLSIRTAGIILVLSVLTIPQNISNLFTNRFSHIMIGSVILGFFASILGLILSYYLDIPSGATIIFTLVIMYLAARFIKVVTFGK